jgi:hypothetical protein
MAGRQAQRIDAELSLEFRVRIENRRMLTGTTEVRTNGPSHPARSERNEVLALAEARLSQSAAVKPLPSVQAGLGGLSDDQS